jgi:X-Pro dipeptidyl-peptidase (S15 family)
VRNGAPRELTNELEAVKRGYAFVEMNERGHFFSEGNYDILGPPLTDGDDELTWTEELIRASMSFDLAQQSPAVDWSNALRYLPVKDIMKAASGPNGIFADRMPVDTGGAMIERECDKRKEDALL